MRNITCKQTFYLYMYYLWRDFEKKIISTWYLQRENTVEISTIDSAAKWIMKCIFGKMTIKFILFHLVNKFHVAYTVLIRPVFNLQTKGITYDIVPEEMCWYEVVLYTLMKPAVFITCHAYNVSNANFWNVFDLVMYVKTVSLSVKQQQLDTVKFLWYLDCL